MCVSNKYGGNFLTPKYKTLENYVSPFLTIYQQSYYGTTINATCHLYNQLGYYYKLWLCELFIQRRDAMQT